MTKLSEREAAPVPTGIAPLYYLRLAFNIMRWDDVSVRRASRDGRSLLYGLFFSMVILSVRAVIALPSAIAAAVQEAGLSGPGPAIGVVMGALSVIIVLVLIGVVFLAQVGLCHVIAKLLCGGKGKFVGILRPLSLAWPLNAVSIIPGIGPLLAAILWAAVLMIVFEEVNGIRRLQAFLISYGVTIVSFAIGRALL